MLYCTDMGEFVLPSRDNYYDILDIDDWVIESINGEKLTYLLNSEILNIVNIYDVCETYCIDKLPIIKWGYTEVTNGIVVIINKGYFAVWRSNKLTIFELKSLKYEYYLVYSYMYRESKYSSYYTLVLQIGASNIQVSVG